MFERFSSDAREVLVRAQEHAHRLGHSWIGCEHLLLGAAGSATRAGTLLRDRGARPDALEEAITAVIGLGPAVGDDKVLLATVGIDLDRVRSAVEATFGPGALDGVGARRRSRRWWRRLTRCTARTTTAGKRLFTPKAKRCLELSLREALRLKDNHVGVEHIALGLLARDDTAAWNILVHLGVAPGELRRTLEEAHRRTA